MHDIKLYNSLSREKETFKPINEGYIGLYVCGPTVYSDVHIGNCRTFVSFDVIYRFLLHLGYKVRYVRNITDVGHLLDDGEDRISKGAKRDNLEPMEVVQKYTNGFHDMMRIFNTLNPSIEPRATGHIIEQIEMVQQILDNGYGYEKNGSVYFNTIKFSKDHPYGELSGRKIDELLTETRDNLKNQSEKNHPSDFAIWMKADENHLMKWNSPWSVGFPGWHLECSVMSTKYLGNKFDIHGGGNDLKFPHHENEIAQNMGACNCSPSNYWLHTNMLLMNGKKMSKSDDNTITPTELFSGDSTHITQAYHPMSVKFFFLQTHYSSTLDLTDAALRASDKGFQRFTDAMNTLANLESSMKEKGSHDDQLNSIMDQTIAEMSDDFNTPKALAKLFELVPIINSYAENKIDKNSISSETLERLKRVYNAFYFDIFGLKDPNSSGGTIVEKMDNAMQLLIELRQSARENKDWGTADKIRDSLQDAGIVLKDGKEGTNWSI